MPTWTLVEGFYHEQSRPDRDIYIDVHLENVEESHWHNFDKMNSGDWIDTGIILGYWDNSTLVGDIYDLKSAMHYNGDAFLTEEAKDKGLWSMTYKEGLIKSKENKANFKVLWSLICQAYQGH